MNWFSHFLRKALTDKQNADLQFMLNTLRISDIPDDLLAAYEKEYLLPLALSNNKKYNERKIQQLVKIQNKDYPEGSTKVISAIYRLGITTRNILFLEPAQKALKELALMGSIKAQTTLNYGIEQKKRDPKLHLKIIISKGIRRHNLSAKKTNALAHHLLALIQNSEFNDEKTIHHLERLAESENSPEGAYVCYALSYVEHPYKAIVRETLATMYYTYGNMLAGKLIQKLVNMDKNVSLEYLPLIDKLKNLTIWIENKTEKQIQETPLLAEIKEMGIKWSQERGETYLDEIMSEINDYDSKLLPTLKLCWKEIDLYV
jgi:hypothetical protein